MLLHIEDAVEALPAVLAGKRLLARVRPLVLSHVRHHVVTLIAALVRTDKLARRPRALAHARFATLLLARANLVAVLDVVLHRALRKEGLAALGLGAGDLLVLVRADVLVDVVDAGGEDCDAACLAGRLDGDGDDELVVGEWQCF